MAEVILYGGALAIGAYVTSQRFRTLVNSAVRSLWHSIYHLLNRIVQSRHLNTDQESRWIEKVAQIFNICLTFTQEAYDNRQIILCTLNNKLKQVTISMFGLSNGEEIDFRSAAWSEIEMQARVKFVELLRNVGMARTAEMIENTEIRAFTPNSCDSCGMETNSSFQMKCSTYLCAHWTHAECAGLGEMPNDMLANMVYKCNIHRRIMTN